MNRLLLLLAFLFLINIERIQANSLLKADTLYVVSHIKDLGGKFLRNTDKNCSIDFFFDVKWRKANGVFSSIVFNYTTPISSKNFWKIPIVEYEKISDNYKIITLIEFTKKLQDTSFIQAINAGKIQLILLYGEECSTKFEAYPIKIGTDLSSEG